MNYLSSFEHGFFPTGGFFSGGSVGTLPLNIVGPDMKSIYKIELN